MGFDISTYRTGVGGLNSHISCKRISRRVSFTSHIFRSSKHSMTHTPTVPQDASPDFDFIVVGGQLTFERYNPLQR
jgi:hypothetical protein